MSAVERLVIATNSLVEEIGGVRTDLATDRSRRKRERLAWAALVVSIIIVLAAGVVLMWQLYRINQEQVRTADQIVGCTTPGMACYEDAQRRSATLVAVLQQGFQQAAWCARLSDTHEQFEECLALDLTA